MGSLPYDSIFRYTWQMDISKTIHMLGDLLGEVISELESPAIFEIEEQIRAEAKARRSGDHTAANAYKNGFRLCLRTKLVLSPPHSPLTSTW